MLAKNHQTDQMDLAILVAMDLAAMDFHLAMGHHLASLKNQESNQGQDLVLALALDSQGLDLASHLALRSQDLDLASHLDRDPTSPMDLAAAVDFHLPLDLVSVRHHLALASTRHLALAYQGPAFHLAHHPASLEYQDRVLALDSLAPALGSHLALALE